MARPIPEVEMLKPGEHLQVDLGAWTPWRRERIIKNTADAYSRWVKKEREAKCQQNAE